MTSQLSHAILVTFERLQSCELLHGPCIGVADQVNRGESSVSIFGYHNSCFVATSRKLDEYFFCDGGSG